MDSDLIEVKISESSGELFIGEVCDQSWDLKPAWLAKFPWVKPSFRGKDYAFCSICYSHLKITSGPFNLETHQRSSKHHIAIKCRSSETPSRSSETPLSEVKMETDSDQQSETHVAAYFRRWIHRHQEAPGCLSKATQDPTCKICFQGFVRLKSFCKHAKIHFEQNIMKCSFCGEDFFSKDALANHMRMPLESTSDSRSPSPTPGIGSKPFPSVYTPNLVNRDSKEVIGPVNSFQIPRAKPYTGGAKPPSYWEWVREAYPHIQLSEEVIQQLETESKSNEQVNDEASFQAMVDLIMNREKQKQMQDTPSVPESAVRNVQGRSPAAPPGTINCHLCNANIRRYDYQAHLLVAHSAAATQPPKFFSCPVCGKSFQSSKELFQHKLQAHTEPVSPQRPVQTIRQCNLCNEVCQNLDELTQHALHVHGVGGNVLVDTVEENLTCPLCATYRFNRLNRDQFNRHLLLYCHGRLFAQKLTTKRIRDLSVSLNVDPMDVMRLLQECKLLQWNDELALDSGHWTERTGLSDRNLPQTLHDGLFYMKTWTNELEDWHAEVPTGDYIRLEAEAERFGPFAFGEYNRQVEPAVERLLPRPPDPGPFRLDYDSLVLAQKVDGIFRQHNLCDAVDIERSRVQSLWEEADRVGRSNEVIQL